MRVLLCQAKAENLSGPGTAIMGDIRFKEV